MHQTVYAAFVLFLLLVDSCSYPDKYQVIDTDAGFQISVPSWMKKEDNLKENAPFQYANRYRNFYAIGEVQEKEGKTLAERVAANLSVVKKVLEKPVVSDSVNVILGDLKGVRVEVFGKMKEENIYFSEVELEGKDKFYHLSIWTRGENRKLRYKADIDKIFSSFRAE